MLVLQLIVPVEDVLGYAACQSAVPVLVTRRLPKSCVCRKSCDFHVGRRGAHTNRLAVFGLVVAFMLPPNQPVIQCIEQYFNLYFFCGIAWAWVSLSACFRLVAPKAEGSISLV